MPRTQENQRSPDEQKGRSPETVGAPLGGVGLFVAVCSLFVAACSAAFTFQQACVGRDQEYRSLRSYLIINTPPPVAFSSDSVPQITIDPESKGQTPVYNMRGFFAASVMPFIAPVGSQPEMRVNCAEVEEAGDELVGDTFSGHDRKTVEPDSSTFHR